MSPYQPQPQRGTRDHVPLDGFDETAGAEDRSEHEDPDLAFIDDADDADEADESGSGHRLADEDDGIPGSEPVDVGPVDPDYPAADEPLLPRPGSHEPRGPGPLPGAPFPSPEDEPGELSDGSSGQRDQRKPGRD